MSNKFRFQWLRDLRAAWRGDAPIKEESAPQPFKIPPSLLHQQLVNVGEKFVTQRKVEPPVLPPMVRGNFVYDAANDPAQLGAPVLALDDSQNAPLWAYLNQSNCGMGFPGYGYLSEMSQRSEFRAPTETIASEMTREWIDVTVKGKASQKKRKERGEDADNDGDVDGGLEDKIERLEAAIDRFKLRDIFRELSEVDGFFGRAQLFIDIDPGSKNPDEVNQLPLLLTPQTIKRGDLRGFKVIEPIWTTPYSYNTTDPTRGDFYKPVAWFVIGKRMHSSRLLTFIAREVPDILKPAYNFGGLSLSQLMEPYVFQWLRTRNSVSDLIHNYSVMCLKTDMAAILQGTSNGQSDSVAAQGLLDRARLFTQTRDNQGLTLLDKNREEMVAVNVPLSTLDKLQAQSQEHMAAPSHIPMVKLTGVTPSGLNASSEGEIKVWYDWVRSLQQSFFGPHLDRILKILQLNEFGSIDEAIGYTFVPLNSPTVKELAEIRKADAETDDKYVAMGAISPDEVRERVGSDPNSGYNNLSGAAPGPPESELMDKQHALGQEGAEADHERGKETAEEAHGYAKELLKVKPKLAKDEWTEGDHPRAANGEFTSGGLYKGAQLITSQKFRDEDIVSAKLKNRDFGVAVSPEFEINGERFRHIIDGHHSLSAAIEAGEFPNFNEYTKKEDDRIALLDKNVEGYLEATHMGDEWHNPVTGKSVF